MWKQQTTKKIIQFLPTELLQCWLLELPKSTVARWRRRKTVSLPLLTVGCTYSVMLSRTSLQNTICSSILTNYFLFLKWHQSQNPELLKTFLLYNCSIQRFYLSSLKKSLAMEISITPFQRERNNHPGKLQLLFKATQESHLLCHTQATSRSLILSLPCLDEASLHLKSKK